MAPSVAPAPTVTTPALTEMSLRALTSMSTPVVDDRPAKQCPPLRTATPSPSRLASASASTTSAVLVHRAIAAGLTSANRGICGCRAASYPAPSGLSTSTPTDCRIEGGENGALASYAPYGWSTRQGRDDRGARGRSARCRSSSAALRAGFDGPTNRARRGGAAIE